MKPHFIIAVLVRHENGSVELVFSNPADFDGFPVSSRAVKVSPSLLQTEWQKSVF